MTDIVNRLRYGAQFLTVCDEAADEIGRLRAENFALAANQCKAGYSGEHGDHMCGEIERLRAALLKIDKFVLAIAPKPTKEHVAICNEIQHVLGETKP